MKNIIITISVTDEEKAIFEEMIGDCRERFRIVYMDELSYYTKEVGTASAIIGMVEPSTVQGSHSLEWLQIPWAGVEKYVQQAVLSEKTVLTNATGAYGASVSEHMVALTLAMSCSLKIYGKQQEQHMWMQHRKDFLIHESTVLVLGTGDIGGNYARLMKYLGAYVIGLSLSRKEKTDYWDETCILDDLDDVIGRADIIAVALPGGNSTFHLLGEPQFRKMKKGVLIVNAGRGSVIDTGALIKALREGVVGGAGLDVFEEEPLSDSPLWDMKNVIITPHVAGKVEDEFNRKKVVEICADNLYRYTHGQNLLHVVDRKKGY